MGQLFPITRQRVRNGAEWAVTVTLALVFALVALVAWHAVSHDALDTLVATVVPAEQRFWFGTSMMLVTYIIASRTYREYHQ
jgi:hypothetical protein